MPESSPQKSVLDELGKLRGASRALLLAYLGRLEEQIGELENRLKENLHGDKTPPAQMRDLRDMLTVLRNFDIKVEKGRRKDLKKLETLIEDLVMLTETWGVKTPVST